MPEIIEMREPSLSISFELVLGSFVRPILNVTPVFNSARIWQIYNNGWKYYDENTEFTELLESDLTLICLPNLETQHKNNGKSQLLKYLTAVYDDCFGELNVKPPLHFKTGLEYQLLRNAYGYTLTLPNPETPASMIFMQLVTFVNNNLRAPERRTIGCCFGISPDGFTIDRALCLSRFVTPTSPGLEVKPIQPIIPEWLIASLFSYLWREYSSLIYKQKEASNNIESSLNPRHAPSFTETIDLTHISNQMGDLRNTLKSMLRNWRNVKTNREFFKQYLFEKLKGFEQFEHGFRGNVQGAFQPDDSSVGVAMELDIDRSVLMGIISFIHDFERAEDEEFYAGHQLEEDLRDLTQKVWELKQDQKDQMQETLVHLTDALRADSANMKIIAILTAFFLPFTFMAILLTTPMFKWPDPSEGEIIIWLPFRIYWAASGGMTLLLGLWGVWLFQPEFIFGKKDKTKVKD